jgi:hypothetical protein
MTLVGIYYSKLRALDFYGKKKLLVGKISFIKKDDKDVKRMPIYLSEKTLKTLNRTFMH